jgi:hypothetical protein
VSIMVALMWALGVGILIANLGAPQWAQVGVGSIVFFISGAVDILGDVIEADR